MNSDIMGAVKCEVVSVDVSNMARARGMQNSVVGGHGGIGSGGRG